MSPQEDSAKQPRRRGRPPKLPARQEQSKPAHEQRAYTPAEDPLSLFSSFLQHILHHDRAGITHVASTLGVSENTIYRWMNGTSEPRAVYLKNLIEALPEPQSIEARQEQQCEEGRTEQAAHDGDRHRAPERGVRQRDHRQNCCKCG